MYVYVFFITAISLDAELPHI